MTVIDNPLKVAEEQSLQPFLPMIYIAWAGGELRPGEIRTLRRKLEDLGTLDEDAQFLLETWLTPEAPPSAAQLKVLQRRLRDKVERGWTSLHHAFVLKLFHHAKRNSRVD